MNLAFVSDLASLSLSISLSLSLSLAHTHTHTHIYFTNQGEYILTAQPVVRARSLAVSMEKYTKISSLATEEKQVKEEEKTQDNNKEHKERGTQTRERASPLVS